MILVTVSLQVIHFRMIIHNIQKLIATTAIIIINNDHVMNSIEVGLFEQFSIDVGAFMIPLKIRKQILLINSYLLALANAIIA